MTIYPADEADNFVSGDLLYRFVETQVYTNYVHQAESAVPGLIQAVVECEDISTLMVALIIGRSFSVRWSIGAQPVLRVVQMGFPLHSETIARLYFSVLGDYAFAEPI